MTIQELYQHLKSKGLYCEIHNANDFLLISVEWGDWKHEHLYLEHIMAELGYVLISKKITDEDGSDCYSADHYYKKIENVLGVIEK